MNKMLNKVLPFIFIFALFIAPSEAKGQQNETTVTERDTIVFTVEEARQIRLKIEKLKFRDSLNTKIIKEQRNAIRKFKKKNQSLETELRLTERKFELYKKRMEYTEVEQLRKNFKTKRWLYTAGGVTGGVLIGIFIF